MTTIMQQFHCDLQPQIQEPHRTTHTWTTTCCRPPRENRFDDERSAAAPAAHTRYPSSPAEATLHGKTQGFVLQLSPLTQAPCNIHATITMRFAALSGKHASLYAHGNKTWPESRTALNECTVMWCKVSHRPSWMYRYVVQSLTAPFMNVLLRDVKSHTALHECIVVWCRVSRGPSWMYCYVM